MIFKIQTMNRRVRLFLLILCFIPLYVACTGSIIAPQDDAFSVQLDIEGLDDLQFSPNNVSVPVGSKVELNFKNIGRLDHNLILTTNEIDISNLSEANALAGINTGILPGGESTTLTFNTPPTGTYTFVCIVPGHAIAGMVGKLTIDNP